MFSGGNGFNDLILGLVKVVGIRRWKQRGKGQGNDRNGAAFFDRCQVQFQSLGEALRRALAFGRLSPEDAAVFCALAEESIGPVQPLERYIREPDLLPKGDSARWFILDCIRQFVRDGRADSFPPKVINKFLRSLAQEHQLILLTDMVEKWGALGAEPAMYDLLRKVAAP